MGSTNAAGARRFLYMHKMPYRILREDLSEEYLLPEDAVEIIEAFLEQMCVVRRSPMCKNGTMPILRA